jgi:hypothetical protein
MSSHYKCSNDKCGFSWPVDDDFPAGAFEFLRKCPCGCDGIIDTSHTNFVCIPSIETARKIYGNILNLNERAMVSAFLIFRFSIKPKNEDETIAINIIKESIELGRTIFSQTIEKMP